MPEPSRTADAPAAPLRPVRLGAPDAVDRAARRRHASSSGPREPLGRLSRQADRAAASIGRARARPRLSRATRRRRRLAQAHLCAGAATRCSASARRCCGAGCRRSGRSPSCPATTSSTRCSALGASYVGIPYAPISPAYSLLSSDFGKLRSDPRPADARPRVRQRRRRRSRARIDAAVPDDVELVVTRNPLGDRPATLFAELHRRRGRDAASPPRTPRSTPDTIAKFLFTSGSTGTPKGVINTHRMLCANQAMLAAGFAFVQDEPPVVVDWLPWSHTFGGNHNFNMVLTNGGSLYIDDGNPTPPGVPKTVRNLREIAPTIYFNVPKGYEALLPHLPRRRGAAQELLQPAEGAVLCRRGAQPDDLGRAERARGRDHRRAHHLPVLARLDRDRRRWRSPAPGISTAPAISACRRPASNSSWCRTKASWRRGCAARTSRRATGAQADADRARPSTRKASTRSATR